MVGADPSGWDSLIQPLEFFFFLVVGNEEIRLSLNRLTDAVTVTFSVFNFLHPRIG